MVTLEAEFNSVYLGPLFLMMFFPLILNSLPTQAVSLSFGHIDLAQLTSKNL